MGFKTIDLSAGTLRGVAGVVLLTALTACSQTNSDLLSAGLQPPGNGNSPATAFTRGEAPQTKIDGPREVIKNPTLAQLKEAGPLGDRTMGNPDASVTVIEYGSWTCPHCRAFRERTWPAFKREFIDTGKIHYILREFPIGRSSGNAALVTRCAPKKDYFKLYNLYLTNHEKWVSQEVRPDRIYAIAAKTGMTRAKFDACLKDKKLIAGVKWSKDRGRELGVIGTPTFFINTRHVRSFQSIGDMRGYINPMLAGQTVASSG